MIEELHKLAETPGSPNLYWALASLPKPLISQYEALQQEMGMAEQVMPLLKDAETADHSLAEWQRLLDQAIDSLQRLSNEGGTGEPFLPSRLRFLALITLRYPAAKDELVAAGFSRDAVEAMPVAQVVAIQTVRAHRATRDNLFKWSHLPYGQIIDRVADENERLRNASDTELIPISKLLLPAVSSAVYADMRLNRRLAMLQTIEAIRMHASANNGALPASLEAITIVPPIRDPLHNEPFVYHVEGDVAILEMQPSPGKIPRDDGRRYELRIQK